MAVIFALKKMVSLFGRDKSQDYLLEVNVDSQLLYKQVRGQYKVKEAHLKPLVQEVKELMTNFKKVDFQLIPREKNKKADRLVNEALDEMALLQ